MGSITDFQVLQPVFDWLKSFMHARFDLHFARVVHRPPLWYFYDADGDFVVKVEEELMDRVYFALNRDTFTQGVPEPIAQVLWSTDDSAWPEPADADEWEVDE